MMNTQQTCSPVNDYVSVIKRFIDSIIHTSILWDEKEENQLLVSKLLGYHNANFSYYDGPIATMKEKEYSLGYLYCDGNFTCDHSEIPFYIFIHEYNPKKPDQYNKMIENNNSMYFFDNDAEPVVVPYFSDNEKKIHEELFQYCNDMIKPDDDVRLAPFLIAKLDYGT